MPHSFLFDLYKNAKKQDPLLLLLLSLFAISSLSAQNIIPPIGQWREHLNYQQTTQVVNGDKIYCATNTNLFSVDPDNEIERFSKVSGLNDVGVQCIGWDATTQQLVIAYTNSNIDVIKNNNTKNISDIKRSSISGNKTIYSVYCKDGLAYLSSGLGVIVVSLSKFEIKDTWFIGNNGAQVKVNALAIDGSSIYAATEEGLKSISVNSNNLSNYANWQILSGANGLSSGPVKNIQFTNNKIIAEKNDSLFILNGNTWNLLYTDKNWPIINITASENKLAVCQRTTAGNARVIILTTTGQIEKNISQSGVISFPKSAITENNAVWIADQFGGLSRFGSALERFIPNGPPGTADGEVLVKNNILYAAAGSVNAAWNYQYNRNGLYYFQQDQWSFKNTNTHPVLDSVLDFITIAVDPTDASVWAGSYGGGLVNFKGEAQPTIYKKSNSSLQASIGDPTSFRVSGLAFDQNKNLWISNYGAPQNLQVRKTDGSWKAFSIPFTHLENAVSQIVVDDINQLWIISPKDNGLFCYNYGQSIDNTTDDKWKFYKQGGGNGNLPSNNVLCLLNDRDGFIWVGTDKGIGIIQCTANVFSAQSCDAVLPIVQLDRFAGLLFKDEIVQCMAVDGANRKWVGSKNGLWLISPNGDKIIYRFTEENSPLLNNDVKKIAVDPASGEVFISTVSGICSFRSTATEGASTNNNVLVFPNPVPPGYNGTIAIRGLVDNAIVKIAELNGKLIFQTRALGGQAIWDGRNYNGQKIASGVYLVIVRDDSGNEKLATKIVITSGR
ncbi:MAG: two-component regulator propeller domain-containing protein [Bacteroidota bacterium]